MNRLLEKGNIIDERYEVLDLVGRGGLGVVYSARELATGKTLALKTFRNDVLTDAVMRESFLREAQTWVKLGKHPFVVSAIDAVEFEDRIFIFMDYIEPDAMGRTTLFDYLKPYNKPIDSKQCLIWAIQFCCGMEYAAEHGIVCHRDIKPSNILIASSNYEVWQSPKEVRIADFGLALAANEAFLPLDKEITFHRPGSIGLSIIKSEGRLICGTPGYIAPEIATGNYADVRSDIYSFSLVLWQMATGSPSPPFKPPFNGDMGIYIQEVYKLQISEKLSPVRHPIWPVIQHGLEAQPYCRYSNFRDMREDLNEIFHELSGHSYKVRVYSDDKWPTTWINRGEMLSSIGKHEKAIDCFNMALSLQSDNIEANQFKAESLMELKRFEEALECIAQILKLTPNIGIGWITKALAEENTSRWSDAIKSYGKYLEFVSSLSSVEQKQQESIIQRFKKRIPILKSILAKELEAQLDQIGSNDIPKAFSSSQITKIIAPYILMAKSTLPQAKARYLRGLPEDKKIYVTIELQDNNYRENAYIQVMKWDGNTIFGKIDTKPAIVESYAQGQGIEIQEEQIIDWTIVSSDGQEEGNYVGKFLDEYYKEQQL